MFYSDSVCVLQDIDDYFQKARDTANSSASSLQQSSNVSDSWAS